MKRRRLLQSVAALPAMSSLAGAQYSAPAPTSGSPGLHETAPDAAAAAVNRFLSAPQRAALDRLAQLIVPAKGERPGAKEARAAEFLEFLVGASGEARQQLYREGLDRLNNDSQNRYRKPFSELDAGQAKPLLTPLGERWTYAAPGDSFARFLRQAKEDLFEATVNSREFAEAMSNRSRRASGMGAYWLPLD